MAAEKERPFFLYFMPEVTIQENVPLAPLTTWKIGGPAQYLAAAANLEDVYRLMALAYDRGWPLWFLGRGSNILIDDAGLTGLTLHLARSLKHLDLRGDTLRTGAGVSLPRLGRAAADLGFSGFEFLAGIPGTVGGAIVMNLVRGSFRFVTGIAAKPAYVIHVPTASITVRGTIFDVYVKPDNSAWLLLIEGAIEVCTSNGKCVVHDEPGKLIRILPDTVGVPVKWAGLPGKEDAVFDSAFPFVSHAPTFDPNPVFTRDQIVLGTFPEKPHPKDTDNGDKGNDSRKKDEPTKKSSKDDDDQPRSKTKHTEVERYHRPRHEASDSNAAKGLNIMLGIGGGLKFGGHHNGGYEGTHRR